MASGENARWWSQTKTAVAAAWHRSGWKTVALVAVPLAVIFIAIATLQRIEMHVFQLQRPHSHHLHIPTNPVGPNWAEIVEATFTVVLAIAAFWALGTIREARRDRTALQMTELSRRWDEEIPREARRKIVDYATADIDGVDHPSPGPDGLRDSIIQLREANHSDYRELLTEPNYLEDLAILVQHGGIDFEIVNVSLGYLVPYRWSLWKPTVEERRRRANEPFIHKEFEQLAKRIARSNPHSVKLDQDGEVVWEGFKE